LSVGRRATARTATVPPAGTQAPPAAQPQDEITYKGYRVEPASYCISSGAWSPRVVVSVRTEDGSSARTPLYATNTARWPTRDEADRRALAVARAWIDAAIKRQRD